jgi:hypothetical protein
LKDDFCDLNKCLFKKNILKKVFTCHRPSKLVDDYIYKDAILVDTRIGSCNTSGFHWNLSILGSGTIFHCARANYERFVCLRQVKRKHSDSATKSDAELFDIGR